MKEIFIDEAQIAKYLYSRLVQDGYAPAADEVLDLAEYVFDFLIEMSYIQGIEMEVEEIEEED
jgi:hypothetical protein